MEIFTVSLFGHRRLENPFAAEEGLEKIVDSLLRSDRYVEFIVGREGDFDILAASVIRRRQKALDYGMSALVLVLPYPKAEYIKNCEAFERYYDEVRICDESGKAYFKAAYKVRNRIVIEQSDLIISCIEHNSGGAYQAAVYAERLGKQVINIADNSPYVPYKS